MIWENGVETCIISYMKRVARPVSMHNTGCLGLVHWDDPEGWYGEGGGRREEGSGWGTCVYLWRIHFDIWLNQYNIVKLKNKIKINKKTIFQNKVKKKKFYHSLSISFLSPHLLFCFEASYIMFNLKLFSRCDSSWNF